MPESRKEIFNWSRSATTERIEIRASDNGRGATCEQVYDSIRGEKAKEWQKLAEWLNVDLCELMDMPVTHMFFKLVPERLRRSSGPLASIIKETIR